MNPSPTPLLDTIIFGGGVAGLWLLNRLREEGYAAVLLERDGLGSGQTRYAQGIIHGGTKYALTGKLTGSSESIAEMPARWRACLAGEGEIDLRAVELLSTNQYMWSTEAIASRMAGFFASKMMRSRTQALEREEAPEVFRDPAFKGHVYRLEEPVLDTATLVRALAAPHAPAIAAFAEGSRIERSADGHWQVHLAQYNQVLHARRLIFAAGKGNADLLGWTGMSSPAMQLRPLLMVMLRGKAGHPLPGDLYAHCLGASANPRITITSHRDARGNIVWYLGGEVAEKGVGRERDEQVAAARRELESLFPWQDFSHCEWGILPIDRAEPRQSDGGRPVDAFCAEQDGVITAWPTKLALAPRLADDILLRLKQGGIAPGGAQELPVLSHPGFAPLPWQEEERWS